MTARLRCARGHFLPATARPAGDPQDWDDTCRCPPAARRRKRRHLYQRRPGGDLWGQGLTARQVHTMTTIPLTGSYL